MTQPSDTITSSPSSPPPAPPPPAAISSGGKEQEGGAIVAPEQPSQAVKEQAPVVEIAKPETPVPVPQQQVIEVPPDIKSLSTPPPPPPVIAANPLPTVSLPISDQQVVMGLHAKITSSLAWLALWCQKKLKKEHLILKVDQGTVIRVPEGEGTK